MRTGSRAAEHTVVHGVAHARGVEVAEHGVVDIGRALGLDRRRALTRRRLGLAQRRLLRVASRTHGRSALGSTGSGIR
jgi:hypothetical protein